jgi:hypothetical protein
MTDLTAATSSLESALSRLHPASLVARIRAAMDAANARHQARKGYRYLLDSEAARRDVGVSAGDVRRALDSLH